MLHIIIPSIFLTLFFGWILYRAFIKRDLRKHLNNISGGTLPLELYAGMFFVSAWAVVYWFVF